LLAKTTFNMAIYSRVIITFFQAIVVWLFSSFEDLINVVKVFKK